MERKEIKIVPGDGKINISPAEDNVSEKLDHRKPKKDEIIIPKISNKKE